MIKAKKPTGTLDLGLDTAVSVFIFFYLWRNGLFNNENAGL